MGAAARRGRRGRPGGLLGGLAGLLAAAAGAAAALDAECPAGGLPGAFASRDRRPGARRAANSLRVATFNAEWLFDGDESDPKISPWKGDPAGATAHLERVADVVGALDADILAVEEVEDCLNLRALAELLNSRAPAVPGGAPDEGQYAPFLVKGKDSYTGQDVGLLTRVDPDRPLERTEARAALPVAGSTCYGSPAPGGDGARSTGVSKHFRAYFDVGGVKLAVLGAHFISRPTDPSRCEQREGQATVMRDYLSEAAAAGRHVIFMGDLNDFSDRVPDAHGNRPTSRVLPILRGDAGEGSGVGREAPLHEVACALPAPERYTSWWDHSPKDGKDNGGAEHSSIDHLLLSTFLFERASNVSIGHIYDAAAVSDHWPLSVTIALNATAAEAPGLSCAAPRDGRGGGGRAKAESAAESADGGAGFGGLGRAAQIATLIGMSAGFLALGGAVGYAVGLRRGRLAHLGRYSRSLSMVNQDFTL